MEKNIEDFLKNNPNPSNEDLANFLLSLDAAKTQSPTPATDKLLSSGVAMHESNIFLPSIPSKNNTLEDATISSQDVSHLSTPVTTSIDNKIEQELPPKIQNVNLNSLYLHLKSLLISRQETFKTNDTVTTKALGISLKIDESVSMQLIKKLEQRGTLIKINDAWIINEENLEKELGDKNPEDVWEFEGEDYKSISATKVPTPDDDLANIFKRVAGSPLGVTDMPPVDPSMAIAKAPFKTILQEGDLFDFLIKIATEIKNKKDKGAFKDDENYLTAEDLEKEFNISTNSALIVIKDLEDAGLLTNGILAEIQEIESIQIIRDNNILKPNNEARPATLEDVLKDPYWEEQVADWIIKLNLEPIEPNTTIISFFKKAFHLYPSKNKQKLETTLNSFVSDSQEILATFFAYKNIFEKLDLDAEEQKTLTDDQKNVITNFVKNLDEIESYMKGVISLAEATLNVISKKTQEELNNFDPDTFTLIPGAPAGFNPAIAPATSATKTAFEKMWDKMPKSYVVAFGAAALSLGICGGLAYKSLIKDKTQTPPTASAPAQLKPAVVPPKAMEKPTNQMAVSPEIINKNFKNTDWWIGLNNELKPAIEQILDAGDAKTYTLQFLNEVEIYNTHKIHTLTDADKNLFFNQLKVFPEILNKTLGGGSMQINECIITVQDPTIKGNLICNAAKNMAEEAKQIMLVNFLLLGKGMREALPRDQTLIDSYNWTLAEIIKKINKETSNQ